MMENKNWNIFVPNANTCVPCRISVAYTPYQTFIWPVVREDTSEGGGQGKMTKLRNKSPPPGYSQQVWIALTVL